MNKCGTTGPIHNVIPRQENLTERCTKHFCVSQYEKVGWLAECERGRFIVRPVYCLLLELFTVYC